MYATIRPIKRGMRRLTALGDVCSVDRYGNRVCGPSMSSTTVPVRGTIAYPSGGSVQPRPVPITPPWGGWNPTIGPGAAQPAWWARNGGYQGAGAPTQSAGINAQALAQMIQIYQTNPSALTASQWATLQQAGIIPSTLPYASASAVATTVNTTAPAVDDPNCVAAGCTGGPYPNCTCVASAATASTDFFSTQYGPLTGIEWLAVAVGGYLLSKRK